MKFCPECGDKLSQPNPRHCPECGAAISESAAREKPQADEARQEPKAPPHPLLRYWAWTISLPILFLFLASFAYLFAALEDEKKTEVIEKESKLSKQLEEQKQLEAAQKKIMLSTTITQYATAIQTDATLFQLMAGQVQLIQNASLGEQQKVMLEFTTAIKDAVYHIQTMRAFVKRERTALEEIKTKPQQILDGLDTAEKPYAEIAASMLDSLEKNETAKQQFGDSLKVLQSTG